MYFLGCSKKVLSNSLHPKKYIHKFQKRMEHMERIVGLTMYYSNHLFNTKPIQGKVFIRSFPTYITITKWKVCPMFKYFLDCNKRDHFLYYYVKKDWKESHVLGEILLTYHYLFSIHPITKYVLMLEKTATLLCDFLFHSHSLFKTFSIFIISL